MNTRMIWIIPLIVLALTLSESVAGAQRLQKNTSSDLEKTIESCVTIVRTETNTRHGPNYSAFDAYINSHGQVLTFGTPRERFSFEKCMSKKGQELGGPIKSTD